MDEVGLRLSKDIVHARNTGDAMGKVSLVKLKGSIHQSVYEAVDLVGGLQHYVDQNDRVMLKPNLNGVEGSTNIELVEALIQLLLDYDIRKLVIAESTFGNAHTADMLFKKTGFAELNESPTRRCTTGGSGKELTSGS